MREMEDSKIEWIGKKPADWKICRIKDVAWLKGRIGWDGLKANEYTDDGPYLITGTDFNNSGINWNTCTHITHARYEEDELLHVYNGDLLITKDGTIGKVAIISDSPEEATLNSGIMIIRETKSDIYTTKFLYYVLMSDVFKHWFSYDQKPGSTITHLYQKEFEYFSFTYPSITEQQKIVCFLDKKCSAIDSAISLAQSQIDALNRYKASVITQAVTKGLDPTVEMKDSGVEWIRKIPKGWKLTKFSRAVSLIGSGTTPKSSNKKYYANGTINWIQSGDLYATDVLKETAKRITEKALSECAALKMYTHDYIVIAMYGASVGNVSISHINACCNQACCCIKPDSNNDIKYMYYWLTFSKKNFLCISEGGGQPNISQEKIKSQRYVQPPLSEQRKIVRYLDDKCIKINEAIDKQNQIIDKLTEYKQSLIYNAVTGKIDVTQEA